MNKSKKSIPPPCNGCSDPTSNHVSGVISASLLAADFMHLQHDIQKVVEAGVDYLHIDVMDHHFVPNLTFGSFICEAIRKQGFTTPMDAHLMVERPLDFIDAFAKAGTDLLTIHAETENFSAAFLAIRSKGLKVGIALNPQTSLEKIIPYLPEVNLILVMSVQPGFAGQAFLPGSTEKVSHIAKWLNKHNLNPWLGVDGGVSPMNARALVEAGANFLVVGSALFKSTQYQDTIRRIRQALSAVSRDPK